MPITRVSTSVEIVEPISTQNSGKIVSPEGASGAQLPGKIISGVEPSVDRGVLCLPVGSK